MILQEILKRMSQIEGSSVMKFSPGPFEIKVSSDDAAASKLLLWLYEQEDL